MLERTWKRGDWRAAGSPPRREPPGASPLAVIPRRGRLAGVSLRTRLEKWRRGREARRLLAQVFRSPDFLRGTSLGSRHAGRWLVLDHESRDGRVVRIRFGILRHPRPYRYSPQSHKVLEVYLYEVESGKVTRLGGHNLTRAEGKDAD